MTTAETTSVDSGSLLTANATAAGDGGQVVVWANGTTRFDGAIDVSAGAGGGNGGFAETSGADSLLVGTTAKVNALAPNGAVGDWLLDPHNITVATGGGASLADASNSGDTSSDITIAPATIDAAAANVTLWASNDVTVSNAISMTNSGVGLTVHAGDKITVIAGVATNNGDITLIADDATINASVDAGTATLLIDKATNGAVAVGIPVGQVINGLNVDVGELAQLSAGTLVFGDPDANKNNSQVMDLYNTFDFTTKISGLVEFNALSAASDHAYVTLNHVDHKYHSVEFNTKYGVGANSDATLTTVSGNIVLNTDTNSNGSAGVSAAAGVAASFNSAADVLINTPRYYEGASATLSIDANSGAGTISFQRSTSGSLGIGDGASGNLKFSTAQLGRMTAATIDFGDTANTTAIDVNGVDLSGVGIGLAAQPTGTVTFAGANSFGSLNVDPATINLNGSGITTAGAQTYDGSVVLGADNTLTSTGGGDITFSSPVDGAHGLTINTGGTTAFNDKVGATTPLSSLDVTGNTITITGLAATVGDQAYHGNVSDNGTVYASTGGTLTFAGGITPVDPSKSVWLLAHGDIDIGGNVQWNGAGDVTLVAGWDGSTGYTSPATTADTAAIEAANAYGMGGAGNINIGDGTQTAGIAVGSEFGTTTVLGHALTLTGGSTDVTHAQLGYYSGATDGTANGAIDVALTGDLTLAAGSGYISFAQIGHGGGDGSLATVNTASYQGDITISAADIALKGGSLDGYAQIGSGGVGAEGSQGGNIEVTASGDVFLTGGGGIASFALVGNGGLLTGGIPGLNISGNVTVHAQGSIDFAAGSSSFTFAEIGNSGVWHSGGDVTGDLEVTAGGSLALVGGAGSVGQFAQIGNSSLALSGVTASGSVTVSAIGDTILATRDAGATNYTLIGNDTRRMGSRRSDQASRSRRPVGSPCWRRGRSRSIQASQWVPVPKPT